MAGGGVEARRVDAAEVLWPRRVLAEHGPVAHERGRYLTSGCKHVVF
jgi:hypothetical protein